MLFCLGLCAGALVAFDVAAFVFLMSRKFNWRPRRRPARKKWDPLDGVL